MVQITLSPPAMSPGTLSLPIYSFSESTPGAFSSKCFHNQLFARVAMWVSCNYELLALAI